MSQYPIGYTIRQQLRETLYGAVYLAHHDASGTPVIIKAFDRARVAQQLSRDGIPLVEDPKVEVILHSQLCRAHKHPYITQLYQVQEDEKQMYTVLEFCPHGDFLPFLDAQSFTEQNALHYFKQLITGLQFMHALGVCHRDLSLENLLMGENYVLKIADFGMSVRCEKGIRHQTMERPGKIKYMAPEVFSGEEHCPFSTDIWSCGVILFAMLTGTLPFEYPHPTDSWFKRITEGGLQALLESLSPVLKFEVPSAPTIDLLSRLLQYETHRISLEDVLADPVIRTGPQSPEADSESKTQPESRCIEGPQRANQSSSGQGANNAVCGESTTPVGAENDAPPPSVPMEEQGD